MGLFLGADELNCNLANKYKSGPQIDIFDCYVYVFSNEQFCYNVNTVFCLKR